MTPMSVYHRKAVPHGHSPNPMFCVVDSATAGRVMVIGAAVTKDGRCRHVKDMKTKTANMYQICSFGDHYD